MAGGLLNLVANGTKNIIVNGNPSKDLFKTTYAKYTNFGMQKFQIIFDGQHSLRLSTDSVYSFTIDRYADMLMDTCFTIDLPHIWSPMYVNPNYNNHRTPETQPVQPYEFKWIKNLGFQLIRSIVFKIGGQVIQQFSGQYLHNMIQRDYPKEKMDLLDKMTGNTLDLNDPANFSNRKGNYPTAYTPNIPSGGPPSWPAGLEPSIRGRKLYIPFNIWAMLNSSLAFPLVALKYNLLQIDITCRSIRELFVVRDMNQWLTDNFDPSGNVLITPYTRPQYISTFNTVDTKFQMCLFLQQPPGAGLPALAQWTNQPTINPNNIWYANPYLMCTYAFLDPEEVRIIVNKPQSYLFIEIHENNTASAAKDLNTIRLKASSGLIRSLMWFFQRNDVQLRNEWSNYTNWDYEYLPYPCISMPDASQNSLLTLPYPEQQKQPIWCYLLTNNCQNPPTSIDCSLNGWLQPPYTPLRKYNSIGPIDTSGVYQYPHITGPYHVENIRDIMTNWSIDIDGLVRENEFNAGVSNYVEKYVRTSGNAERGLYCYNFCLLTNPLIYQPNGAMNTSPVININFNYRTILPPLDPGRAQYIICDPSGNYAVGINKVKWNVYSYNYNLYIMGERYNYITFENGNFKLKISNL